MKGHLLNNQRLENYTNEILMHSTILYRLHTLFYSYNILEIKE